MGVFFRMPNGFATSTQLRAMAEIFRRIGNCAARAADVLGQRRHFESEEPSTLNTGDRGAVTRHTSGQQLDVAKAGRPVAKSTLGIRKMHLEKLSATMASALLGWSAAQAQTLNNIYEFVGGTNAASPLAGVAIGKGSDGGRILYGATTGGGLYNRPCPPGIGCGVIFSLSPPASPQGTWTENVIYSFTAGVDGWLPAGVRAATTPSGQTVLYGTTWYGGEKHGNGSGTVFALTQETTGGSWKLSVLHRFQVSDGEYPYGGVVLGGTAEHPVLYGTSFQGGSMGYGTVWALALNSSGTVTETVLHNFTGGQDGQNPDSGLTVEQTSTGQTILFGTTVGGGPGGGGTVFAVTSPQPGNAGGAWTETILHGFGGPDGSYPWEGVTVGGDAPGSPLVLYGTTAYGGASGYGTVYSLTGPDVAGGAWNEEVLYSFTGSGDGGQPEGVPVADWSTGSLVLYGTSVQGGTGPGYAGCGTAYSVTQGAAGGAWTEAVLHAFTGGADGCAPTAGLTRGKDGSFYGTTNSGGNSYDGTVYELIP